MTRLVADVGNSRLKWGLLGPDGALVATAALPVDDPDAWRLALDAWCVRPDSETCWAISTVNPPASDRLAALLGPRARVRLYRSAADVPVPHRLATPATTGADRALAVLAALDRHAGAGPGQVVSCGTAVTVERIGPDGVWQGGAIAPGPGPAAFALNQATAQLPRIHAGSAPPAAWGNATEPALAAGVFWGVAGAIRELLARQADGLDPAPWRVWTGGDAATFAGVVEGPGAVLAPDLVLEGLILAGSEGPRRHVGR